MAFGYLSNHYVQRAIHNRRPSNYFLGIPLNNSFSIQCAGPSMEPLLSDYGDFLVVTKYNTRLKNYRRNDVVIARSPIDPALTVCKRLLGFVRKY